MGHRVGSWLVVGVGGLALACATGTAAYAASASSSVAQFSTGGHTYDDQATASSPHTASTGTWNDVNANVPGGYIGSEGRMFRSDGSMCSTSGMQYMPGPGSAYFVPTNTICGAGYYFSYGKSAGWNGNGYSYNYTFRSPNVYMG